MLHDSRKLPTNTTNTRPNLDLRRPLPLQELRLLNPALLHIHKEKQKQETRQAQREQKVERITVRRLLVAGSVDDSARDQRADERGCFADDAEEGEEEEFLAAGGDFGDHGLAVAVPGADEEAVVDLVEPD